MPTTPFPAPATGLSLTALEPLRARISCLTSHGGLTGVPQVSLPGALVAGRPVGLSIVGPPGSDATLVAVAKAVEAAR
jgi:amidase